MSRATVETLAKLLSQGIIADGGVDPAETYFSDIVSEITLQPDCPYVNATYLSVTTGTSLYSISGVANAVEPLNLAHDGLILSRASYDEASYFDDTWFDTGQRGFPIAWTQENENRQNFRLIPTPQMNSAAIGGATPFNNLPAEDALTVIYTEIRTNPQPEEELFYLMELMAREFARDSDHTDHTLSQACHDIGRLAWKLIALGADGDLVEPETASGSDQPGSYPTPTGYTSQETEPPES